MCFALVIAVCLWHCQELTSLSVVCCSYTVVFSVLKLAFINKNLFILETVVV